MKEKGESKKKGRKGEKEEKKDRSTKNKGIMVCKESEMESKKRWLTVTILGSFSNGAKEGFQNRWNNIHPCKIIQKNPK